MGGTCPNCGHSLVVYRTDRQIVGRREAVLTWTICRDCRHVALHAWTFADEVAAAPRRSSERRAEAGHRILQFRQAACEGA